MSRILISGGTGFWGQHILQELIEANHEIASLERYVTGRYSQETRTDIKVFYADIRDFYSVTKIVRDFKPEQVIHLAAVSANSYSYDHPQEILEVNFVGTVNLAEGCRREVPNLQHFIFAGSSEMYGTNPNHPYTEESVLMPHSPYAVSKVSAENYLLYMNRAYLFPVTSIRCFNSYGRDDNQHFFMEKAITQALTRKELRLGDPRPIRDWLYIKDVVDAYLTVLGSPDKAIGEVFNFCTGRAMTIKETVEIIVRLTDFKGKISWYTIPNRPLDIPILVGSARKANGVFGWKPKYQIEEGIKETVEYWRQRISK